MLVVKTPLRISLFGGGTDIPEFFDNFGYGLTISFTIDKFIYLAVNKCVAPHLKVVYSALEHTNDIEEIKHDRVKAILKHYNLTTNMEICSMSDVPTKGTGLGSSSTFTVGLINAVHYIKYKTHLKKQELAELAFYIEREVCKEPVGFQDQYAAAYGGINQIEYSSDRIVVNPLFLDGDILRLLESRLLCFNTGITRLASSVLTEQLSSIKEKKEHYYRIRGLAIESMHSLSRRKYDALGPLLHESWKYKKKLSSNITNPIIDEMYDIAMKSGATGGKILGAGGGGYMLFYVPEDKNSSVLEAMKNYERLNFKIYGQGSTVNEIL